MEGTSGAAVYTGVRAHGWAAALITRRRFGVAACGDLVLFTEGRITVQSFVSVFPDRDGYQEATMKCPGPKQNGVNPRHHGGARGVLLTR